MFLGLVALYSAMQVDAQFKVILPDDQSSIAQQEINDHVSTKIAQEFEVLQVDPAHAGKYQVGRGDARIAGHLFYPYFIDVMNDGLSAALAASELGAALSALMHHGKKSNITTLNEDALNKLVVRCIDKVQRNESRGVDLTSVESRGRRTSRETPNRASL